MKTLSLLSFIILFCSAPGFSQWKYNITAGFSPKTTPGSAGLIINRGLPHEEFIFNMSRVNHQFFIGLKAQRKIGSSFFTDIGLTYTKQNSTYQMEYTFINDAHPESMEYLSQSEHLLMLPANIGVNLGAFDITSGLRAFHAFKVVTELNRMKGFSASENLINLGWQWGGGFYISRSHIGLEYLANFSCLGSDLSFNGQSLVMMNIPGQWVLSFQHRL